MAKPTLCLLIAAYNEEDVLEHTIRSAIKAGMDPKHIYIVSDNSIDRTGPIAMSLVGRKNYMRVHRSGKGLALTKAARKFQLSKRYHWIHLADADGAFAPDYFKVFRKQLDRKFAAATGYIKSLPGSIVGQYRVMDYTIGMDIVRRFQAMTGLISIIPGPTSCFRADVFDKVAFNTGALAEDFDVTLQIHRQNLGPIQFIEDAVAYTQDPMTFRDFVRQMYRWNRGILQGVFKHRIGTKAQKIDIYLTYQVGLNLAMFLSFGVFLPLLAINRDPLDILSATFVIDVALTAFITLLVAARSKRWDIINAFPHLYAYRWASLMIFMFSFVRVALLGHDRKPNQPKQGAWETAARAAQ